MKHIVYHRGYCRCGYPDLRFTSHSNFASRHPALFQKKEQDAADAVDKVDSRVAAARSAQEGTVKKGRASSTVFSNSLLKLMSSWDTPTPRSLMTRPLG